MINFKAGDRVKKRPNAGFIIGEGVYAISDEGFMQWSPCLYCGEEDCQEWNTLYEIEPDGTLTGNIACHVSDCELIPYE